MNLWGHRFFQNPNQKLQRFLPWKFIRRYGKNLCNFWLGFLGKRWPCIFILNLTDLYQSRNYRALLVIWFVEIVLVEGRNFRRTGFPANCRTEVGTCAVQKFSTLGMAEPNYGFMQQLIKLQKDGFFTRTLELATRSVTSGDM